MWVKLDTYMYNLHMKYIRPYMIINIITSK